MSMYADDKRFEDFHAIFGGVRKPIIGMVHLLPLPGSPLYDGAGLESIIERALRDLEALEEGGVDAVQVENFSDPTYSQGTAYPELIAALSIIADRLVQVTSLPMGICLLADPQAGLAVAHAVGAKFVRATFFSEASVDVSGLALPKPHDLLRYRKFLDPSIKVFADVHIKHSAPLAQRPIGDSALDAKYFLADGIIISGTHTGKEVKMDDLVAVKEAVGEFPVLLGSGFRAEQADVMFSVADAAVVGTSVKFDGVSANPVDVARVKDLMQAVKAVRDSI